MRPYRYLLAAALALVFFLGFSQLNAADAQTEVDPPYGDALCPAIPFPPGLQQGRDCLRLGPAAYLDRMAQLGITFPLRPLAYRVIAPEMSDVEHDYMIVRDDGGATIPLYASLADARTRKNAVSSLKTTFTYIAYRQIVEERYVQTASGYWVARGDVSPVTDRPPFRGLVFPFGSPDTDFGWLYERTAARSGPGEAFPFAPGEDLRAQQVVRIYTTQVVDGVEWYLVGPDRWLSDLQVNRVAVRRTPPSEVPGRRWIDVNLDEQVLAAYEDGRLAFATVIATGLAPLDTKPGLFQIYMKLAADVMTGYTLSDGSDFYYLDRVPWTMYFDGGRALHGAYWRARLGRPQSHGCVNLAIGDARWLFDWAREGDWVYVWDAESPVAETAALDGG